MMNVRSKRVSLRRAFLGGAAALVLSSFQAAWALDPRTGGTTLLETMDARASALGEAGSSLTGDLSGVAFNPAVVTTMNGAQLETQFEAAPGDVRTGLVAFGRGGPRAGWSASLVYLDAGTIELVPTVGTPTTARAQQDLVGTLSGGLALTSWFRVGGTVKGLQSKLVEDYSATAVAGDAGILMDLPLPGLRLGAAAQNLGADIAYRSSGDPLPRFYRGGLSYTFSTDNEDASVPMATTWYGSQSLGSSKIWVGADAVLDRWGAVSGNLGFEWDYAHKAIFRLGGILGAEGEGVSGGVGFWIQSWRLDYAVQFVNEVTDRHRLSVSYFWKGNS